MWHYETLTKESAYVVCRRDGRVLCSISLLNWVVVFIVPETILHVHTALRSFLSALVAYGGGRSGARCPDLYIFGLGFNAGFPGQLLHNHGRQATVGQGQYRGDEHQGEVVSIHIEYELVLAVILTAPFHFCSIATES